MFRFIPLLSAACFALPAVSQQKNDAPALVTSRDGKAGVFDLLNEALNPTLANYVKTAKISNFDWPYGKVQPGVMLPSTGAVLAVVPGEYGVDRKLRLSRVNNQFILVDPATRKVVQIVN